MFQGRGPSARDSPGKYQQIKVVSATTVKINLSLSLLLYRALDTCRQAQPASDTSWQAQPASAMRKTPPPPAFRRSAALPPLDPAPPVLPGPCQAQRWPVRHPVIRFHIAPRFHIPVSTASGTLLHCHTLLPCRLTTMQPGMCNLADTTVNLILLWLYFVAWLV